jgi:hypothetical protein
VEVAADIAIDLDVVAGALLVLAAPYLQRAYGPERRDMPIIRTLGADISPLVAVSVPEIVLARRLTDDVAALGVW